MNSKHDLSYSVTIQCCAACNMILYDLPCYNEAWLYNEFLEHRCAQSLHDDVIKWKHFPRNWPFVRGIHRSPVNSQHKGQWRRALMFSLICGWINDWANNRENGDLRRYRAHYDVIIMASVPVKRPWNIWVKSDQHQTIAKHGGGTTMCLILGMYCT